MKICLYIGRHNPSSGNNDVAGLTIAGATFRDVDGEDSALAVVRDFDFAGIVLLPTEKNPVLLVDPDAVLILPVPPQSL